MCTFYIHLKGLSQVRIANIYPRDMNLFYFAICYGL